uniref:Uncharacterized protein LOC8277165 isoform X1 n=1 Tax=Rhizophora mucronata TaxID=61149 RepID=A0A2P2JM87_RHIMU
MEDINLLSDLSRLAGSALGEKRSGLSKTLTANCAAMFTCNKIGDKINRRTIYRWKIQQQQQALLSSSIGSFT